MIRTAGDEYEIQPHKIINALLRKNRRYFSEEKSNFSNLFFARYDDDFPDPFVRVDILLWLKKYYKAEGPNLVQGYHQAERIIKDLQLIGHNEKVIYREIKLLIKKGLIFSENQTSEVNYGDLIKISPSGSLHIDLLSNLSYLAACAEDVIYRNPDVMMRISKRIASANSLDRIYLIATAKDMIDYLHKYRKDFLSLPEAYIKEGEYLSIYDLSDAIDMIESLINSDSDIKKYFDTVGKYPKDSQVECKVINKKSNSIMCLIDDSIRGFLATTEDKFKLSNEEYNIISIGENITCKVIEYSIDHGSIQLEFVKK